MLAFFHITASGIGVATVECGEQLLERDAVRLHFWKIRLHLILLDETTVRDDICHARDCLQLARDDPILDRAHFRWWQIAPEPVPVDFADWRGQRSQFWRYAGGQVYVAQTLEHLLPGEISIDGIVKCDGDEREAKLSMRKQSHRVRNTAEGNLDWNRYLLLDLLSGAARIERDHLNLRVRHIRNSLNGQ